MIDHTCSPLLCLILLLITSENILKPGTVSKNSYWIDKFKKGTLLCTMNRDKQTSFPEVHNKRATGNITLIMKNNQLSVFKYVQDRKKEEWEVMGKCGRRGRGGGLEYVYIKIVKMFYFNEKKTPKKSCLLLSVDEKSKLRVCLTCVFVCVWAGCVLGWGRGGGAQRGLGGVDRWQYGRTQQIKLTIPRTKPKNPQIPSQFTFVFVILYVHQTNKKCKSISFVIKESDNDRKCPTEGHKKDIPHLQNLWHLQNQDAEACIFRPKISKNSQENIHTPKTT